MNEVLSPYGVIYKANDEGEDLNETTSKRDYHAC